MIDIIYICILFHMNMRLQIVSFHAINSAIIKYFLISTDVRARKQNTKLCYKFLSLANTIVRVIFFNLFLLSYFANNHHYYGIFQILQIFHFFFALFTSKPDTTTIIITTSSKCIYLIPVYARHNSKQYMCFNSFNPQQELLSPIYR